MPPSLSLCMIVKNEESNLERCLQSVQGVADEIVVVDTGSTDRTMEIALAHGARLFQHAWRNDFAEARNVGLAQATSDWVLVMDADEELEADSGRRFKEVLARVPVEGLFLLVRNFLPFGSVAAYDDFLHIRVFRNRPAYRYELNVHEQIGSAISRAGGQLGVCSLQIWHHGYTQQVVQKDADRDRRNIELLEQALAREPQHAFLCAKLGLQYCAAGNYPLAEVYLRRVLTLDYRGLAIFLMQDVLGALGLVALDRKDYAAAIDYASASLGMLDGGSRAVTALNMLAEAYIRLGEREINVLLTSEPEASVSSRFQALRQHLEQATAYLNRLLEYPELSAEVRSDAELRLAECETLLKAAPFQQASAAPAPTAAATLQALLEADDLPAALQAQADQLDPELLALVRVNAEAARLKGEAELAAGLEALGAYIDEQLVAASAKEHEA